MKETSVFILLLITLQGVAQLETAEDSITTPAITSVGKPDVVNETEKSEG